MVSGLSFPENLRIGSGFDAHKFCALSLSDLAGSEASERPDKVLRLAGLDWPGERVLEGHSDGDVVVHAIIDALLSGANIQGSEDIGAVFGVDRPETKGMNSLEMLQSTVELIREHGFAPLSVSVNVIGNSPKISPRRGEAAAVLETAIWGKPCRKLSLLATTTDGLGFTGRGEGIACSATTIMSRAKS